jgi:prepilin-type processing-associated H-X9-DG protein
VAAVHEFHNNNGTMPTYLGLYPPKPRAYRPVPAAGIANPPNLCLYPTGTMGWCNGSAVYGSWFVHVLPYVGEDSTARLIDNDVETYGENMWADVTYYRPASNCSLVPSGDTYNGHPYNVLNCQVYEQFVFGPIIGRGIWQPALAGKQFRILRCSSAPSVSPSELQSFDWGGTNYLANWNAWGDNQYGPYQGPQAFAAITDGLSNTILLGEGYVLCNGSRRTQLHGDEHYFGIQRDWTPSQHLFQVRPLTTLYNDCPTGRDCCDDWRTQTGHDAMNVAFADGSARNVSKGISKEVWRLALLPRDGEALFADW